MLLHLNGVQKKVGGRLILKDVSLQIEAGERLGLLGDNGAGKSTLIKVLASVLKADRGKFYLKGITDPSSRAWKEEVVWVPQDIALDPDLTVEENLHYWSLMSFAKVKDAKQAVEKAKKNPLVHSFLNKRVRDLSGGMSRRANLMSSLLAPGSLILLDEPFVGADRKSLEFMEAELIKLSENGAGLLICSHDQDMIERLCTRRLLLEDGVVSGDV